MALEEEPSTLRENVQSDFMRFSIVQPRRFNRLQSRLHTKHFQAIRSNSSTYPGQVHECASGVNMEVRSYIALKRFVWLRQ